MKTILFILFFGFIIPNSVIFAQLSNKTIYVESTNDVYSDTNMVNYAYELANYLYKIEGNTYTVNTIGTFTGTGILLAQRAATTNIDASDNAILSGMSNEGFMIDANDTRIKIIGNHHKAVSHGMFSLLKKIGCYFLTPAEDWTIIPNNPAWNLNTKIFDQPDYSYRNFWYANGDGDGYDSILTKNARDREVFFRATLQGGIGTQQVGHSYQDDLYEAPAQFQAHPEWFGMDNTGYQYTWSDYINNGATGNGVVLEYSDMNLAALMLQHRTLWLQQYQQNNPDEFMVSMEPNDGSEMSYSSASMALGNKADQVLNLANYVANNITTTIPNAEIAIYCYGGSLEAPLNTIPANNIYGEMAMAFNNTDKSFNEMANAWITSGLSKFGVYEYMGEYQWDLGLPHCQNTVSLKEMKERIPYAKNTWNAKVFNVESQANWGRGGPSYYVAHELMWNVNADADLLYDEYLSKAFGNAANTMKLLYDDWENGYDHLQPTDINHLMLHKWLTLIQQALNQVTPGTPEHKRVQDIYAYIHYCVLFKEYFDAEQQAELLNDTTIAKNAAIPLLEFGYRIRHRQVIQFWAFQFRLLWERPILYNSDLWAGWDILNMDITPTLWMTNGDDYTSSELDVLLSQDLNNYPEDPLVKNYHNQLIPLYPQLQPTLFTQQVNQMDTTYHYGVTGFSQWYFYSDNNHNVNIYNIKSNNRHNEGFDCEINHALIEQMSNHSIIFNQAPVVNYQFGEIDTDTISNISLNKGLYRMELQNSGSDLNEYYPLFDSPHRFVVEASPRHPLQFSMGAQDPSVIKKEDFYFYVPSDIDTLYLHHNYYFRIQAPSWSAPVDYDWTTTGFLKIPITNSIDKDTVWKLDYSWTENDNFYFLNIPPYLSNAPENLLYPNPDVTGTKETDLPNIKIYPNPAHETINIVGEEIQSISIIDIKGREINNTQKTGNEIIVDVSNYIPGIYLVTITTTKSQFVKKIIIQ